jgi:hypothetical protein
MVFQSSSGLERNKNVQLTLAVILIAAAGGFFIFARSNAPNEDSVTGTYRNACCSEITVKNGSISYDGSSAALKLRRMKFGITGYVSGRFTSIGIQTSKEPTAVLFSIEDGKRALSLPIDGHDRVFQLAEAQKNSNANAR